MRAQLLVVMAHAMVGAAAAAMLHAAPQPPHPISSGPAPPAADEGRSSPTRLQHPTRVRAALMSVALEHEHPFPTLEYASDIAQQIPCLREVIRHVAHDTAVMQLLAESHESLQEVTDYLRPSAKVTVRLALEVALLAHHGQARRSGEPFVTHPVAVAVILAKNSMEKETIVSGLLHDTVEDTPLTFADIERVFGDNSIRN